MFKLKNRIKKVRDDELVRGSFVIIILLFIYNLLNYIFQISMANMLGPADYGILAVLMSFIYILGIPGGAIQTIASKYTSKFNLDNDSGKIKDFLIRGLWKGFLFALLIYILSIPVIIILSPLLKIKTSLLLITFLFLFYILTIPVIRGVMQGKKKFFQFGINLVIESSGKVIFAFLFVFFGFNVFGAIGGVICGALVAFLISLFSILEIIRSERKMEKFENIYLSNVPVLISMISLVLLYSLDVILVRIFFPPEISGQYAFVSLIAKAIFFGSSAIASAMLPISSEKFERNNSTNGLFKKAVLMILAICVSALFFYFFFPNQIIRILSLGSSDYLSVSRILFILGLAYSFIAIGNLFITYGLSINKIKNKQSFLSIIFVILEVILLSIFNSDIVVFSMIILIINFFYFLYTLWLILKK